MKNTVIVIPTYNELDNIEPLLKAIFSLDIPNLAVVIVDDRSPDGTAEAVRKMIPDYPIFLIERNKKMGLGSAYIAGFKKALAVGADIIFEMDADFSHDPRDIPKLIASITNGADLAIGSRRIPGGKIIGWNRRRRFTSRGATWISRLLLGIKTKDVTAGFRAFKKEVLLSFPLDDIQSNGYAFQEELLYRVEKAGFKIAEIPVIFTDRQKGKSKLGRAEIVDFFVSIFKLRFLGKNKHNSTH
ncbi:MAG: polyprenol monophosphomannose synthase [Candidatus Magasanikbacteria bacterium]|nr:polyprenol monophosphomannose synthase [Candidatus Magasanikbacteria bacterium]